MAERQLAAALPALSDERKLEIFTASFMHYLEVRPTHAPRENRAHPSQLSGLTRCAAWAVDAVKAAEYCWEGERTWRAQPKTYECSSSAAPAAEGSGDASW